MTFLTEIDKYAENAYAKSEKHMRKMDAFVKCPHISLKTAAYATKIYSHLRKRLHMRQKLGGICG